MIREPKGEAAAGIGSRLVPFVQRHGHLARPAQSADDPQFTARDHGLIDDDIGHGRRAAVDKYESSQQPLDHHAHLANDA
jgi:hypothetical protein